MIWDSVVWKRELSAELTTIERAIAAHDIESEDLCFRIEKFYFLSAYIIRKLLEAKKLSSEVSFQKIETEACQYIGGDRFVDYFNAHHLNKLYDLSNLNRTSKDLRWLCNNLIHSFCFSPSFNSKRRFCGIFFNSDESKRKELHFLRHKTYKKLLKTCINDDIVFSSFERASNKKVSFNKMSNARKWLKQNPPNTTRGQS